MPKNKGYTEGFEVKVDTKIEMSFEDAFYFMVKFAKKYPEAVKRVVEVHENEKKVQCPFPEICDKFPCKDLVCGADVCSNGYAHRMS